MNITSYQVEQVSSLLYSFYNIFMCNIFKCRDSRVFDSYYTYHSSEATAAAGIRQTNRTTPAQYKRIRGSSSNNANDCDCIF